MTENNKELKACPFCGGEPLYELNSEDDTIIVCQKCGAGAAPSVWCARHNEAPTGDVGELVITIDQSSKDETAVCLKVGNEVFTVPDPFANELAAQLQQAQKMREALLKIIDVTSGNTVQGEDFLDDIDFIEETAKQALNNKG